MDAEGTNQQQTETDAHMVIQPGKSTVPSVELIPLTTEIAVLF